MNQSCVCSVLNYIMVLIIRVNPLRDSRFQRARKRYPDRTLAVEWVDIKLEYVFSLFHELGKNWNMGFLLYRKRQKVYISNHYGKQLISSF